MILTRIEDAITPKRKFLETLAPIKPEESITQLIVEHGEESAEITAFLKRADYVKATIQKGLLLPSRASGLTLRCNSYRKGQLSAWEFQ